MMKTPKETSVLITFQKPTAIWDMKNGGRSTIGRTRPPNNMFEKKYNINTAHMATIEYYTLHVIYHINGTQVMSAISNHDFDTKPYVKAPRYDKTSR